MCLLDTELVTGCVCFQDCAKVVAANKDMERRRQSVISDGNQGGFLNYIERSTGLDLDGDGVVGGRTGANAQRESSRSQNEAEDEEV